MIDLSKKARRGVFGIGLHGWEQLMLFSLLLVFATTVAVVILQRREAKEAKHELEEYKLTVEGKVADAKREGLEAGKSASDAQLRAAEANKEAAQARLELQKLQSWRMVDPEKFNAKLVGIEAPSNVDLLYVPECSDCFMVASMVGALLKHKNWPFSLSELKKLQSPSVDWMVGLPATLQHRANPTGVSVLSKNANLDDEKNPARALMFAIGNSLETGGFLAPDASMPEGIVRIVIAPKI